MALSNTSLANTFNQWVVNTNLVTDRVNTISPSANTISANSVTSNTLTIAGSLTIPNASIAATKVAFLANTNAYIATKTGESTSLLRLSNTNSYIATKLATSSYTAADVQVKAALANTNSYIATKTDESTSLLRLSNTNSYIATKLATSSYTAADVQSKAALANTNSYIATKLATSSYTAANTTSAGKVELATDLETAVGTDTARAVTPNGLKGKLPWGASPGTPDAIQVTYSPALTGLPDGQLCFFRAAAANATTTPTFNPNGLGAQTIVKNGNQPLAAGDIAGQWHEIILRYRAANTRWELLNPAIPSAFEPGFMIDSAGASVPSGWLACDGSNVSRTTYADLFAEIGTTWGAGDGSTTFAVPDSRRRVAVGSGGTGTATLGNALGNTGGAETHTLTTAELAGHTHGYQGDPGSGVGSTYGGGSKNNPTSKTTDSTGGGGAHNNMQPSYVVTRLIKT